ncbi:Succinyl-CoA:(R)-benzylsuccinate CoA-transferase subunit BbsE [bacterium HR23]|nr:Succinyl-CoA:(R)-benzylsuccinate CoA-transferase subunit BbsE [bacterium HR23]
MLLAGYRILDLTDPWGVLAGRMLADLGAEVIAVEPPGGSPARRQPPFWKDDISHSLFWGAYAGGKKSITLDLTHPDGRAVFLRLVAISDAILETHPPGALEEMGLGWDVLRRANPSLVLTSITPFGREGPYARWKATDLTIQAMGGLAYVTGDSDRPPVRISFPQAWVLTGISAGLGTVLALFHRTRTGQGQRVDLSAQHAVARTMDRLIPFVDLLGEVLERHGHWGRPGGGPLRPSLWPCKDGWVCFLIVGGGVGTKHMQGVIAWMEEEGFDPGPLKEMGAVDFGFSRADLIPVVAEVVGRFLKEKSKAEIWEQAQRRRLLIAPVSTPGDAVQVARAIDRGFFRQEAWPDGVRRATVGSFVPLENGNPRRAPALGEHQKEVLEDLLGFTPSETALLREVGALG